MPRKINWSRQFGRRLNLRDLHVFLTVAHEGSMARAAAQLGVTQPTVSEAIADLEDTYGVRLFDRKPHGVEPTMYGHALLKRCTAAFDELRQSGRDIEFIARPTVGDLWIGCQESLLAAILPAIIKKFRQRFPRVVLHVDDVPSPDLQLSDLRARKHDLVLARVVQPFSEHDEIAVETLFNDRVVVVAHRNSRWARRRRIKLEELVDEDWMLTPTNSWVHSRLIDAFQDKGLKPPTPSLLTLSIPLRVHLLAGTDCLTAFASSVFRLNTARYELTSLPVDLPRRPWPAVAVTLKNRTLHPLAEHFLECAREVARPLTQ
jgi:DNA-binding transcriptional LysR family regulator